MRDQDAWNISYFIAMFRASDLLFYQLINFKFKTNQNLKKSKTTGSCAIKESSVDIEAKNHEDSKSMPSAQVKASARYAVDSAAENQASEEATA